MSSADAASAAAAVTEFEELDFAYCGRRLMSDGTLALCIRPIKDGALQGDMLYSFTRKAHRAVGGVYRGAKFQGGTMSGLQANLQFVRRWDQAKDLIDWQARDEAAESHTRSKKLEADAKKASEIEKIMLPLRAQYDRYKYSRDHAGMEALRDAVLRALTSKPRPEER